MSDEIDRANTESQAFIDNALRAQRTKNNPPHTLRPSRATCIDCDAPIPVARQNAIKGCVRCVACQHVYERGAR